MNSQDADPQSTGLFSRDASMLGGTSSSTRTNAEWQQAQAQQEAQQQAQQQAQQEAQQEAQQHAMRKAEKLAYNALARREYSAQELEEKLLRKNTPVDIVKMVLRQVRELDLQSDERFTESFVRSRISRGQGPVRIEMELKQRGISTDLVDQHLAAEESFWLAQAKAQLARRGARSSAAEDALDSHFEGETSSDATTQYQELDTRQAEALAEQQRQKQRASYARFLSSRGFRSNTIARALEDTLD